MHETIMEPVFKFKTEKINFVLVKGPITVFSTPCTGALVKVARHKHIGYP